MFSPKRDETRPGYEMRKEHIAIGVMILLCLPILAIYVTFFAQAFVADGKLSLSNFRFLYTTIVLGQYTVPTMGPAFRNTVIFTLCVTACEVVISLMAGYALSRMRFTGRNFLQKLLLILRLFPGVLLLISILYVLMYTKLLNTLLGVVMVAIALRLPRLDLRHSQFLQRYPQGHRKLRAGGRLQPPDRVFPGHHSHGQAGHCVNQHVRLHERVVELPAL